jgi:hypothetical protein
MNFMKSIITSIVLILNSIHFMSCGENYIKFINISFNENLFLKYLSNN